MLDSEGFGNAFLNSLAVTIPATVIPITIAAFAAYAFAWMDFPGGRWHVRRRWSALLVDPAADGAHPAAASVYRGVFGSDLPIAERHLPGGVAGAHRVRLAAGDLPVAELHRVAAVVDASSRPRSTGPPTSRSSPGSIVPLSVPALASFAIFQFLWVWNDLLIALVFLGGQRDVRVVTQALARAERVARAGLAPADGGRLHHDGASAGGVLGACSASSCVDSRRDR